MFKFNFGEHSTNGENNKEDSDNKDVELNWFPARKVSVQLNNVDVEQVINLDCFNIKLVNTNIVVSKLAASNCEIICEAESQHSDLLPAKYEGGLKIWECTYDLGNYLVDQNIPLNNKTVLDLGCGAGVLGIIALLRGSIVNFQDYNSEVIENVTIPNVMLNSDKGEISNCDFYCGDWASFEKLLCEGDKKKQFDYIFTSETIYNQSNHRKLYSIFKNTLKHDGIVYVAGKSLYFGVGGTMRQFEQLVVEDNIFDVSTVWKSDTGVQREVLMLTRKSTT